MFQAIYDKGSDCLKIVGIRIQGSSAMNLRRTGVFLVRLGVLVTVGCASQPPFPESSLTGRIIDVKVGETLTPNKVTAKPGDEIRWVNTTSAPAEISFDKSLDGILSCQRGFVSGGWVSRLGSSDLDFLVIGRMHDRDYASLCFSARGTYAYDVRMEKTGTGRATRIPGIVTIE